MHSSQRLVIEPPNVGLFEKQDRLRPLRYGGSVLFQMGLEHPKSRHRQLSVYVRQFQEFVLAMSLRQIALE